MRAAISFGNLQATIGLLAYQEARAALGICSGLGNKEVAKVVGCAPGTVKKTVERIFFKLGVTSRSALVAEAFRRGLIQFAVNADPEQRPGKESETVFLA